MTSGRGIVGGLVILAATIGGVAAATLGLTAIMIPAAATGEATPTPQPSFDLAVAPTAIGGILEVSGDRSGTMLLDTASGMSGRYELREDGLVSIFPASDAALSGPDGRITFERHTGEVTVIEYGGLSFYLDPGECTVTEGAVNEQAGLMTALVECPEIADIRGNGVVSVAGVVAMPIETLRGRAGLPVSGGSLEIGESSLTFDEAEIVLDGEPGENGRITTGSFTEEGGMAFEYDPDAEQLYLTTVSVDDLYAVASEACPIASHELGRINQTTTVLRLEIECTDFTDGVGDRVTVTGTIVADVIEGLTEVLEP